MRNDVSTRSKDSHGGVRKDHDFSVHESDLMHGTGPYDSHPTSIHKKRVNKNYRSQHTFNLDKISQAEGRSLQELLGDISVPGPKVRGSIDSSFMKIEVWTVIMMLSHRCLSKAVVCKMIAMIRERIATAMLDLMVSWGFE